MTHAVLPLALLAAITTFAQFAVTEFKIDDFNPPRQTWEEKQITFATDSEQGHIGIIHCPPNTRVGGTPLALGDWAPKFHTWHELRFEYQISNPTVWFGVKITDKPLLDGWQAVWKLPVPADADKVWQTAVIDLQRPMYKWGDSPVNSRAFYFRYVNNTPQPLTIKVANLRLVRKNCKMNLANEETPLAWQDLRHATAELTIENNTDQPLNALLAATSSYPALKLEPQPSLTLPPHTATPVTIRFAMAENAPPLTAADLIVKLLSTDDQHTLVEQLSFSTVCPQAPFPSPCLLLTAEQLPAIRERIQNNPDAAQWWKSFKATQDHWLDRDIVYPPRGAQWWHWYSCKKCGTNLKTASPTRHVCPNCKAEYTGYPYDDVVLARDHDRLANAIRDLGLVYLITQDRRYAAKARDILLGYAEIYLNYPLHDIHGKPAKGGGHVHPQTLDEAIWLIAVVQGTDAIRDTLTDAEFNTAAEKLIIPAAYHIKNHQWGIHNICCWHDSAYGLAGILLNRADLLQPAINGPKGFLAQVNQGITDDGQWYERAWGYHFYTTSALEPLAIAIHNTKIIPLPQRFKLLFDAPLKFLSPTSQLPAFHDAHRIQFNPQGEARHYELSYAWWHDPVHGQVLQQTKRSHMNAVLHGADTITASSQPITSENFRDTGVAILRSQRGGEHASMPANYIAFDYGEHGGGHGHPDKLNFVLWAHRTLLAEDPGCIAYGNPAHGGWYRQTISHNTLVVDGTSQKPATGKCLAYAASDNAALVVADAGPIYPNLQAGRALALIGDTLIDLLWARDTTGAPRRLEYAFHSRGDLALPQNGSDCQPPEGTGYTWAKDWRTQPHQGKWNASWLCQDTRLTMAHASSAPGTLLTARGTGNPPTVFFNLVLNRLDAPQALYASAFAFSSADRTPAVTVETIPLNNPDLVAAKAIVDNSVFYIFISTNGQPHHFEQNGRNYTAKALVLKYNGDTTAPEQILLDNSSN